MCKPAFLDVIPEMRTIAVPKQLSPSEEKDLIRRAQENDSAALDFLIRNNLRWLIKCVNTLGKNRSDREDLLQEAALGLQHAILKFNLEQVNCRLVTYANHWVKQRILYTIEKTETIMSIRHGIISKYRLHKRLGDTVPHIIEIERSLSLVSLNLKIPDFDRELGETVIDSQADPVDHSLLLREESDLVKELLSYLDPRSRQLVVNYYGIGGQEPIGMAELSEMIGLTKSRVQQILAKALKKIREKISHSPILRSYFEDRDMTLSFRVSRQ